MRIFYQDDIRGSLWVNFAISCNSLGQRVVHIYLNSTTIYASELNNPSHS